MNTTQVHNKVEINNLLYQIDCLSLFHIIDLMTPAERRILFVLVEFQSEVYEKKKKDITPCKETIAIRSNCSRTSVTNFIKKYEGILFKHAQRRIPGCHEYDSNSYFVIQEVWEFCVCLHFLGFKFQDWKKHRFRLLKNIEYDPHFVWRKTHFKQELSTQKVSSGVYEKLSCIKSYKNAFLNISTKKGNVPVVHNDEERKKKGILEGLPLNFTTKQKLVRNFSYEALMEAKNDYFWFGKCNKIHSPDRLFVHRAKEHQMKYIQRL